MNVVPAVHTTVQPDSVPVSSHLDARYCIPSQGLVPAQMDRSVTKSPVGPQRAAAPDTSDIDGLSWHVLPCQSVSPSAVMAVSGTHQRGSMWHRIGSCDRAPVRCITNLISQEPHCIRCGIHVIFKSEKRIFGNASEDGSVELRDVSVFSDCQIRFVFVSYVGPADAGEIKVS